MDAYQEKSQLFNRINREAAKMERERALSKDKRYIWVQTIQTRKI
jgi:hypothetical protein